MLAITDRPERIFGNVALASLMTGVPIGIMFAIAYLVSGLEGASFASASKEIAACLLGPTFLIFLIGGIGLGLPLWLLRRIGMAGPAIAFGICAALGLAFAIGIDRPAVALGVIATSIACGVVFCRLTYASIATRDGET
jgi:hypothetical protein